MENNDIMIARYEKYQLDRAKFFEELDRDQYDYFQEMSQEVQDIELNINISVSSDDPASVAYFRVYNHYNIESSTKVMQLHFKDSGMEYQPDPFNREIWIPTHDEIEKIKKILNNSSYCSKWQCLCYEWNYQNSLIDGYIDEYLDGDFDKKYINNKMLSSIYIPSNQKMPETWIYNAEQRKKEKFKYW